MGDARSGPVRKPLDCQRPRGGFHHSEYRAGTVRVLDILLAGITQLGLRTPIPMVLDRAGSREQRGPRGVRPRRWRILPGNLYSTAAVCVRLLPGGDPATDLNQRIGSDSTSRCLNYRSRPEPPRPSTSIRNDPDNNGAHAYVLGGSCNCQQWGHRGAPRVKPVLYAHVTYLERYQSPDHPRIDYTQNGY